MKNLIQQLCLLICSYFILWTMDIVPPNTPEGIVIVDHLGALSVALLKLGSK